MERLQALEGFKKITAPFDGVVTARETDIGALINAGSGGNNGPELFRVADIHKMRVYVQVPQQLSAGIQAGLTAELHLPQYPDKTFKATVATTSSAINMSARTLLVELHADNPDGLLQPGAYAQVNFELPSNPNVVRIPTSALIFREQRHGSRHPRPGRQNRAQAGDARTQPRHRGRNSQRTDAADRLVNSPPDSLSTGDTVRIAGASAAGGGTEGQTGKAAGEDLAATPPDAKPH